MSQAEGGAATPTGAVPPAELPPRLQVGRETSETDRRVEALHAQAFTGAGQFPTSMCLARNNLESLKIVPRPLLQAVLVLGIPGYKSVQ